MLNTSPESISTRHVVGESYEFEEIRRALGGESIPPNFVIHRKGLVLGLCLGLMWNPLAENDPAEVWVGRKGDLPAWGVRLAGTKGPLPVYVRREEGGKWYYTGLYEVTGSSTELTEIQQRLSPPAIKGISHIVFLKRVTSVKSPPGGAVDISRAGEPSVPTQQTAEEQMALFEKSLKQEDWGHQPC